MTDTSKMKLTPLAERHAFTRGFAVACANLARDHGEDGHAEFLLEEAGYTLADMIKAGLEPYDLDVLAPIFAEIQARAARTAKGVAL